MEVTVPGEPKSTFSDSSAIWEQTLTHGRSDLHHMHKLMRLLPGPPRCKVCYNPFGGFGGRLCRFVGMSPSRKNPRLCALCCEKLPPGGAEVETAILFADVRGSTAIAEKLGPTAFAQTLNSFYRTATEVLIRHDATVDKLVGDEVMAFFIPGFAGPSFKQAAVDAGQALRRALGYGGAAEPPLPIGIGIDCGTAFVGNVGGEEYVDFTALGDPVNTAARIQAAARPGELLIGEAVFAAVAEMLPNCEMRFVPLKGKSAAIVARSVPLSCGITVS